MKSTLSTFRTFIQSRLGLKMKKQHIFRNIEQLPRLHIRLPLFAHSCFKRGPAAFAIALETAPERIMS